MKLDKNNNKNDDLFAVVKELEEVVEKIRRTNKESKEKTRAITDCVACGETNFVKDAETFETPLEIIYTENFTCQNCGNHTDTITRITKIARGN